MVDDSNVISRIIFSLWRQSVSWLVPYVQQAIQKNVRATAGTFYFLTSVSLPVGSLNLQTFDVQLRAGLFDVTPVCRCKESIYSTCCKCGEPKPNA
jgi:hypothetical protein